MPEPPEPDEACLICQRVAWSEKGQNPYFIQEFRHSIFVLGDHQFHKGYSLILLKEHLRELHELPPPVQTALFQEVMTATQALVQTFQPWKMNHSCYGNAEQHVHWHLFPRYDHLPDHRRNPWLHSQKFKDHPIDTHTAQHIAQRIRENLAHS